VTILAKIFRLTTRWSGPGQPGTIIRRGLGWAAQLDAVRQHLGKSKGDHYGRWTHTSWRESSWALPFFAYVRHYGLHYRTPNYPN
jgi:hypothetical protein